MSDKKTEVRSYFIGALLSALLTILAFSMIYMNVAHDVAITVIVISALAQLVVQGIYFLHLNYKKQSREDLQLVLFSTMLLLIMVFGTIWVLGDLMNRMG